MIIIFSQAQSVAHVVLQQLLRERQREVISAACVELAPAERAMYVAALPPLDKRALSAVVALLARDGALPTSSGLTLVWGALTQSRTRPAEEEAEPGCRIALCELVAGLAVRRAPPEWRAARALTSLLRDAATRDVKVRDALFAAKRRSSDVPESRALEHARLHVADALAAADAALSPPAAAADADAASTDRIAVNAALAAASGGALGNWDLAAALLLDTLRRGEAPLVPSWGQAGLLMLCTPDVLPDAVSQRSVARALLRPMLDAEPLLGEILGLLGVLYAGRSSASSKADAARRAALAYRWAPLLCGDSARLNDDGAVRSAGAAARRAKLAIEATKFLIAGASAEAEAKAEAEASGMRKIVACTAFAERGVPALSGGASFADLHAACTPPVR